MDPATPGSRNPLPQVPFLAGAKIDVKITNFLDGAFLDKDAVNGNRAAARESFKWIDSNSCIAIARRLVAVRRDSTMIAARSDRRRIFIQRRAHFDQKLLVNPVVAIKEQKPFSVCVGKTDIAGRRYTPPIGFEGNKAGIPHRIAVNDSGRCIDRAVVNDQGFHG